MRARFVLNEVFNGLRRNSTMALSVVLVTFVSLAFVGAAALLQVQVQNLKDDWYERVEVSVFLCPTQSLEAQCQKGEVTETERENVELALSTGALEDLVEEWRFESKEEAYANLIERDENGIFVQHLTADQMGSSFRVKLVDPEQFQVVADAVAELPGVEEVVDQREIFDSLFTVLNRATLIAAALAGVMLLAATLLITTTIRLSALSRRRETTIMRMVGSSRTLIQLPFMLEGAISATVGALLAIAGLWVAVRYLVEDWLGASLTWIDYVSSSDVLAIAPWLVGIAVALAAFASLATLGRYTRA